MSTDTDATRVSAAPPGSLWSDRLSSISRHDLPASIVVFLVALPLSLGIAIASDAPVAAGLIAAAVGGIVVGFLGGSLLQVSGPAAGLTVVVAEIIHQFGWKTTCFITAAAGVLQIVFGLSRIARAALAIAPVVVHAMLAGIGVTIALQQVHVLLGGASRSSASENMTELPGQLLNAHGDDFVIGTWDCYGGLVEMPTMKRIAERGVQFTQFHTTALRSPSRASLLTGRNATSVGMATIEEFSDGFPSMCGRIPEKCESRGGQ